MTLAIMLSIFAPFLWAMTNHIDKYMLTKIDTGKSNIKVLLVFSTFVAGLIISPIWLILSNFSVGINPIALICVLFSSWFCILTTALYFKAIEENDTTFIIIMYQMTPVFSYILAFILFKETLSFLQIIGSIIILLSAIIISIDFKEKNNKKKMKALILMTLSSLCFAINYILFDVAIRNSAYYSCAFWFQIGFLIVGIILISIKAFRESFIEAIKRNGKKYVSLNVLNETFSLSANLLVNYANLTIPIALANVLNGFQGAFVFIIGVIGTIFFPKFIKEDLSKDIIIQKVVCILIGIIGLIILVYN